MSTKSDAISGMPTGSESSLERRSRSIAASKLWLLLGMLAFSAAGCLPIASLDEPTAGNTPQEMFEAIIHKPIPASVTKLEGVGDTWQGYAVYLRFRAAKVSRTLIAGYKPTPCATIAQEFVLPKGYDRFKPTWNPNLAQGKCYIANEVKNRWTHYGIHHLHIDPKTGVVHFYGFGA